MKLVNGERDDDDGDDEKKKIEKKWIRKEKWAPEINDRNSIQFQ